MKTLYSPMEQNTLQSTLIQSKKEEEIWEIVKKITFENRKHATFFLQFTLGGQQGKTYDIVKNGSGGRSLHLRCAGCQAFIKFTKRGAKKDKVYGYLNHSPHEDICSTFFHPKPRHLAGVIDRNLLENCRNKTEAALDLCEAKNWVADKSVVQNILFRGVSDQKTNEVLEDIHRLEPFLLAFVKKNPECKYRLDKDGDCFFERLLFYFSWAGKLSLVPRIVAIDACHMKDQLLTSKHCVDRKRIESLKIIALTTKGSNNNNILLAFSLCLNEKHEEFIQIINFCKENGLNFDNKEQAIISDRAEAIRLAVSKAAPSSYHICCPLHLKRNLESRFGKHKPLVEKVSKIKSFYNFLTSRNCSSSCFKLLLQNCSMRKS